MRYLLPASPTKTACQSLKELDRPYHEQFCALVWRLLCGICLDVSLENDKHNLMTTDNYLKRQLKYILVRFAFALVMVRFRGGFVGGASGLFPEKAYVLYNLHPRKIVWNSWDQDGITCTKQSSCWCKYIDMQSLAQHKGWYESWHPTMSNIFSETKTKHNLLIYLLTQVVPNLLSNPNKIFYSLTQQERCVFMINISLRNIFSWLFECFCHL